MSKPKHNVITYFAQHLFIVLGLVLMWRGTWYLLDWVDASFFGNNHTWTALAGIAIGILVLYLPDRDLKEIAKL